MELAPFHAVPSVENQSASTILSELALLVVSENAEGLGGIVRAHDVGGVQDVAELIAGEAIGASVPGVELGTQ